MAVKKNLKLMKMVDDAWNDHDWDALENCFAEDAEIFWPDRLEPRKGKSEYMNGAKAFTQGFPDAHIDNDPYKVCFGQDDWTCSIALMKGTNTRPMMGPDGSTMPPTNKPYRTEYCTVTRWRNNLIVELHIFYDMASMMRQLGMMPQGSPNPAEKPIGQKVRTVLE